MKVVAMLFVVVVVAFADDSIAKQKQHIIFELNKLDEQLSSKEIVPDLAIHRVQSIIALVVAIGDVKYPQKHYDDIVAWLNIDEAETENIGNVVNDIVANDDEYKAATTAHTKSVYLRLLVAAKLAQDAQDTCDRLPFLTRHFKITNESRRHSQAQFRYRQAQKALSSAPGLAPEQFEAMIGRAEAIMAPPTKVADIDLIDWKQNIPDLILPTAITTLAVVCVLIAFSAVARSKQC